MLEEIPLLTASAYSSLMKLSMLVKDTKFVLRLKRLEATQLVLSEVAMGSFDDEKVFLVSGFLSGCVLYGGP